MNAPIKFSTQKGEGGTVGYSVMTILLLYRLLTAATHGEHEIFFLGLLLRHFITSVNNSVWLKILQNCLSKWATIPYPFPVKLRLQHAPDLMGGTILM